MEYRKLGNSDLYVSKVCLGCMGFGDSKNGQHSWTLDETHSREIIKKALEEGINFFDTAIGYQSGTSEQYLGRALKDFAKRDDVIIATKFLPRTNEEVEKNVSAYDHISSMINTSLRNLGQDYVDLYIYHMWDYQTPILDILTALDKIIKEGKVRYIGLANAYAYQVAKANALADKYGLTKFVSVQNHYNLIFREEEREMVRLCHEDNIAMTPYSALASGRLSRRPGESSKRSVEDTYAMGKYDKAKELDEEIIKRVIEIAEKRGVSMSEVSLSWLMEKTTSPIAGTTKISHVETAAKATELKLTDEEMKYLEEPYVPHHLVGVMADNTPEKVKEKHVWGTGSQKVEK